MRERRSLILLDSVAVQRAVAVVLGRGLASSVRQKKGRALTPEIGRSVGVDPNGTVKLIGAYTHAATLGLAEVLALSRGIRARCCVRFKRDCEGFAEDATSSGREVSPFCPAFDRLDHPAKLARGGAACIRKLLQRHSARAASKQRPFESIHSDQQMQ